MLITFIQLVIAGVVLFGIGIFANWFPKPAKLKLWQVAGIAFVLILLAAALEIGKQSDSAAEEHAGTQAPTSTTRSVSETSSPATSATTSSSAPSSTATPQGAGWTAVWPAAKTIDVPGPDGTSFDAKSVDLDVPRVYDDRRNGNGLLYTNDGIMAADGAQSLGVGPVTTPAPDACFDAAQTRAAGLVRLEDMVPGKTAWCVITAKNNVVWVRLLSGGGVKPLPTTRDRPKLTFEIMGWTRG